MEIHRGRLLRTSSLIRRSKITKFHWAPLVCPEEGERIPKDVPKGHTVVYVGETFKRFIVRVSFLEHPLFQALLDQARDEYEFKPTSNKLCIPCDEGVFSAILSYVSSEKKQKFWLCC